MRNSVRRQTKIVSSIGPASGGVEFPKVMKAGADIFRFNFSHDTIESHRQRFEEACTYEKALGLRLAKFADMQGPKHRIGLFKEGTATLEEGKIFRVDLNEELGDSLRVHLPHPEIFKSLQCGASILINDGQIHLEVVEAGDDYADAKVLVGGEISNKKGFNVPNILLDLPCITEKDKRDIEAAIDIGFKLIVISFVQTAKDMEDARAFINGRARIIAKIEKPAAMDELAEIVSLSDGVMIGRGDMAVEASYPVTAVYHKRMVQECIRQNKPVIVATQMLESMIENPFPTRAEVSDIANAVYEGADCTMLSAESTVGKYPAHAIRMMSDVIGTVEEDKNKDILDAYKMFARQYTAIDSVLEAKLDALIDAGNQGIIMINPTAEEVGRVACLRKSIPIFPIVNKEIDEQHFFLFFGMNPILTDQDLTDKSNVDAIISEIAQQLGASKDFVGILD